MKQALNVCTCQELDAGPAIRMAIMQARGRGDEAGAMEEAVPACCAALGIYADTTSLLQVRLSPLSTTPCNHSPHSDQAPGCRAAAVQ